jgi:hypothetical protein
VVLVEVAAEHNPAADYSEVYHPIAAAGLKEVDPMADAVGVVRVVERRTVGVLVVRWGCIDYGSRDYKLMSSESSGLDAWDIAVHSSPVVGEAAGCSHLRIDRRTAVAT